MGEAPSRETFDRHALKAARKRLGMTQHQLADALGIQRPTVARWEVGIIAIQQPTILRLALERLEIARILARQTP